MCLLPIGAMEQIGNHIATITSASIEERLERLLLAMFEQAIVSIAATGHALALNHLRDIASALESYHTSWVPPMTLSRGLSRAGGPGEKLFKKMKMIFLSS